MSSLSISFRLNIFWRNKNLETLRRRFTGLINDVQHSSMWSSNPVHCQPWFDWMNLFLAVSTSSTFFGKRIRHMVDCSLMWFKLLISSQQILPKHNCASCINTWLDLDFIITFWRQPGAEVTEFKKTHN